MKLLLCTFLFCSFLLNISGVDATIMGLTTTADNGVERFTTSQDGNGAMIDGESVVLDRAASRIRAVSASGVAITNTQVRLDSDVTNGNDNNAPLTFGARANTTNRMRVQENSVILAGPFTGRRNIFLSELSGGSSVIEAENTQQLFVYTQTDAILDVCTFRGIQVWEVYRSPSVAFKITVDGAQNGYLNWEAGRLDFIGFKASNINQGSIWIGQGNGGNNQSYHWNNDPTFDEERFYLTSANNRYYGGYTASWEFVDRDTGSPIQDAELIYIDDRGGLDAEQGRYTTNASGYLTGTYDTQFETAGANQERSTLYVRTNQVTAVGANGSGTFPATTITGGQGNRLQNYNLDAITPKIEVRSYEYQAPPGFNQGDTFPMTQEIGEIKSDGSVLKYQDFVLIKDEGVTETDKPTVLGYPTLDTTEKLYDRIKAEWRDNDGYPLATKDGLVIDLGSTNLVIDATAATAYAYAAGTNTITVNSGLIDSTSKLERVRTTGTITRANGAILGSAILDDSVGVTGQLTLTGLDAGTVLVFDDASAGDDTIRYLLDQNGTLAIPFDATSSTDFRVVVRRTGFSEVNFNFDPSSGGFFEFPIVQFQSLTIEGVQIYNTTGDISKITMDFPGRRINIGDFTMAAQEFYDTLQDYESTELGMKNPRIMNYDGGDRVLLLNDYRLRNRDGAATIPGVNAFVFAETTNILDAGNGYIQFLTSNSVSLERQEQLITMLEHMQGSSWNQALEVFVTPEATLSNITGTGFDPATDSLSNIVQSMLDQGILDVNTIKDLVE